jgi:mRNA interferase MazF
MRGIQLAQLDKTRPVLVLTAERFRPYRHWVTVAPITSTVRGLSSEVPVGRDNGLDHESVVDCGSITTIRTDRLGRVLGYLLPHQEHALLEAIRDAFDLI